MADAAAVARGGHGVSAGGASLRVGVLAVGDELVTGDSVDTNSAWIAGVARDRGHRVVGFAVVPDDVLAISRAVEDFRRNADVLVVSGGLGPTLDDLTRDGVAAALGRRLVPDEAVLARLAEQYGRHGRAVDEISARQALFPRGARVLPNPVGTAPGFVLRYGIFEGERAPGAGPPTAGGFSVACVPGVPSEMRALVTALFDEVFGGGAGVPTLRLHLCGPPESEVGGLLADLMERDSGAADIGITVKHAVISVCVRGDDAAAVRTVFEAARERLGRHVFGEGDASLAGALVAGLTAAGLTLTTAESCTGGLLAGALTAVPGSSEAFREGAVTYSNESKQRLLGVPAALLGEHGAVSEACARAMAEGQRRRTGADLALSVTGIAGPSGGSADKPVGTVWCALASADGTVARHVAWTGTRDEIRGRAVNVALDMARRHLARR